MKIAMIIPAYEPARAYGGPVASVSALAEALVAQGHLVSVLTSDLMSADGERIGIDHEVIRGVRVRRFRTDFQYRWASISGQWLRQARKEISHHDVVHIFGFRDGYSLVAATVARMVGVPVIWEPKGMLLRVGRSQRKKWLYDTTFGLRGVRTAKCVIATAKREREEIEKAGVDPSVITIRPNGLHLPPLQDVDTVAEKRQSLGIAKDDFVVGYLGRINYRKGLDFIARVVAQLNTASTGRRTRLLLVGPIDSDDRDTLDAIKSNIGDSDNLLMPGPAYSDDKWLALAAADAFVLASPFGENFGNAAAEAMAVGTPAFVSDACGVADWISDANGEVLSLQESEWVEALGALRDGDTSYDRATVAATVAPLQIEQVAKQQATIYQRVVRQIWR